MKNSLWSIVSIIVVLLLSITTWSLYASNKTSSNKVIVLTEHKNVLEASIAKIADEKKSVEDKLVALSAENNETKAKINEYSAKMEAMAFEHKTSMDQAITERDRLKASIAVMNKELADKNSEILLLKKSLDNIDIKLTDAMSGSGGNAVNLDPIVMMKPNSLSGKIIEVNKEFGFVIVNLGSDSGIAAGDTLFVSRRDDMLGKVVVEETAPKYCAAKILMKSLGDTVRYGDTVAN